MFDKLSRGQHNKTNRQQQQCRARCLWRVRGRANIIQLQHDLDASKVVSDVGSASEEYKAAGYMPEALRLRFTTYLISHALKDTPHDISTTLP